MEVNQALGLQRRIAEAERFAALGALAAQLAHELGTPLHSISGHLDLMLSDAELHASARRRAEIVAGEVNRLCTLLQRYLYRLRAPSPELRPTNVNRLVERIASVVEPLVMNRGVRLQLDLDPAAADEFECDPDQIEQVVINLVRNALDATPERGELTLSTLATPVGRTVSMADNGCGIDPDILGRVFEPFFSTKAPDGGTGLGLALCREIARNHGGDLVLDSKPGLGTVVTLSL